MRSGLNNLGSHGSCTAVRTTKLEEPMSEGKFRTEEFRVEGEKLIAKIKELLHEGNIRRIIIKDKEGKTIMEIPMTLGVVGVLIAPQLAAIGAIAALLTEATILVEKSES
jgi:Domain of unknown function (DUF4342)